MYDQYIKRILDFIFSLLLIVLLIPLLIILCFAIRVFDGPSVIFTQVRVGKNNDTFKIFKFRTMRTTNSQNNVTKLGGILRSSSLDELPELFNILLGQMSFVGPRPLLVKYLPRYSAEQLTRHDVLPGLTGLAQIRGRNYISWSAKFRYDKFYTKNISLRLDLFILFRTVLHLIKPLGTSAKDGNEMPEFLGDIATRDKIK